jgi:hypothetical protein
MGVGPCDLEDWDWPYWAWIDSFEGLVVGRIEGMVRQSRKGEARFNGLD